MNPIHSSQSTALVTGASSRIGASFALAVALLFIGATPAGAEQSDHKLGEHPAVISKQLAERQGYDYASKFYPHPAWLYLSTENAAAAAAQPSVAAAKASAQPSGEVPAGDQSPVRRGNAS